MGDQPGCPCSICGEDSGNPDVPLPTERGNYQNLRDRIAAVLQAQPPVRLQSQSDWLDWTENRADAVIAELGLKRMEMGEWDVLAQGFRGFRYVTPWDVDDE